MIWIKRFKIHQGYVSNMWTTWVMLPYCTKLQQERRERGCLWVRSRGDSPAGGGAASHSTCSQEGSVNGAFYRQLAEASFLLALILMEHFSYLGICWKGNTALSRQSRSFLHCTSDNFSVWMMVGPAKVTLDLPVVNVVTISAWADLLPSWLNSGSRRQLRQ